MRAALLLLLALGCQPARELREGAEDALSPPAGAEPAPCAECVDEACATQAEACSADPDGCPEQRACLDSCQDSSCGEECVRSIPSYRVGQPLRQCVSDYCRDSCPQWR